LVRLNNKFSEEKRASANMGVGPKLRQKHWQNKTDAWPLSSQSRKKGRPFRRNQNSGAQKIVGHPQQFLKKEIMVDVRLCNDTLKKSSFPTPVFVRNGNGRSIGPHVHLEIKMGVETAKNSLKTV
jgi:hypothetical protein